MSRKELETIWEHNKREAERELIAAWMIVGNIGLYGYLLLMILSPTQ